MKTKTKNRIKYWSLPLLALIVGWFIVELAFAQDEKPTICIEIDEKYLPRTSEVYEGERADFLKAIWEDDKIQDFHIVINDCEVIEFYPSSKVYLMSWEDYQKINNRIMEKKQ